MTSNQIALLALVVSLISFWLTYKTNRANKLLAVAERKTQVHALLVDSLLEAQGVQLLVAQVLRNPDAAKKANLVLPPKLPDVEKQLSISVDLIKKAMADLKAFQTDDPIQLETLKSRALEGQARINQTSNMIKELRLEVDNSTPA